MIKTIFLVGGGNIGRRHLQALLATGKDLTIVIVEPDAQARAAATEIFAAAPHVQASAISQIEEAPRIPADLAIVATAAQHRRNALEALLNHAPPRSLLLEKVLFTTRRDLDEMEEKLDRLAVPAWVNCGRRGFPLYEQLRLRLAGAASSLVVTGSRWGLCCNGIHFLDLVDYVLADTVVSLSETSLSPVAEAAKRPGCLELYGTLNGKLAKGGSLRLHCSQDPGRPLTVTFDTGYEQWEIDETNAQVIHNFPDGQVSRQSFEMFYVSTMPHLYTELLTTHGSRLPTYAVSAAQHRLFIDAIRKRLGLSIEKDEPCPIS